MADEPTFILKDLEGRPGLTTAYFVRSRTAAKRLVASGCTVTSADSNGALNVWRDHKGQIHAAFCRHLEYLNHTTMPTLTDLDRWLKLWWPRMKQE